MKNSYSRLSMRNAALRQLNGALSRPNEVLIIHYSCESFQDIPEGKSARITSIGVRYFDSGQCKSFSIHKVAELESIPFSEVENKYNHIERRLLDDFFGFVEKHKDYIWIHWNMRDINFGFEAINHRYRVLGGTPIHISNKNRFDLSRILIDIFGIKYIGHPRLEKMMEKNKISKKDYLSGEQESVCFEKKEFVKLHKSTLRKIDIIHNIILRVLNNSFKHESNAKDIYGVSFSGLREMVRHNVFLSIIFWLINIAIGGWIVYLIGWN